KFIYILIILADDIRRGGMWLMRLFSYKEAKSPSERREMLKEPLPEVPEHGISRSGFLMRSGILMASLPIFPLSWGMISGAYDYRVRRQKLVLPNLPKAFHGMRIAQISDVHSGSFYNKKAVLGGVEMLLQEKPDMIFFTGDLVNNQ